MVVSPQGKKRVAVIGGGPSGMYAALTAAGRGHEVTLYERTNALGGALKFADKAAFKYSLARFKNYLIAQIGNSSVNVCLGTAAGQEVLKEEGYDVVIAAVGAEPLIPPIPGIQDTIYATDTYGMEAKLGNELVVIGGGQVGCETALHLAMSGKKVTMIEMQEVLAPDASKTHRDDIIAEMEKESNLTGITAARCTGITSDSVTYEKNNTTYNLQADNVILAAGMKPKMEEADSFAATAPVFWETGDCKKARTVEQAVREGYFAGINI